MFVDVIAVRLARIGLVALACTASLIGGSSARAEMAWTELPPLPVPLSGHFSGTHNDALIVAGGTNFPVSPYQGGEKQWLDRIYVLEPGATAWKDAGALPHPRAYGGTVSLESGIWLIGGTDGQECFNDILELRWEKGALQVAPVDGDSGKLPGPSAFHGAAKVGEKIYVVGGQSTPGATEARASVWQLALGNPAGEHWSELPTPLPGGPRILPVVVSRDDQLFVFSGASLFKKDDGTVGRVFLKDGHQFSERSGWKSLAGPPVALVGAPAMPWGQAHILVSSGDDGSKFDQNATLGDAHRGFSNTVWAYHTITDTWVKKGEVSTPYVTTQAVSWQGAMVIPGGEDRPGHRGAMVLSGRPVGAPKGLNWLDYSTLGLYFGTLVLMGLYFTRREQSMEVFFLGGRKVPWWAVGLSIFGTSLSSITFLAIPANAFSSNWVAILSNLGIVLVAPIVVYYYIPRYREKPIPTAYAYLETRFNLATRMYGSFVFILFQLGRMAIILYLPSIALSAATGMSITLSVLSMGAMTTFYTMLGGIEAVIWTDVVQSVILLVGAGLALFLVAYNIEGGLGAAFSMAMEHEKFHTFNWSWDMTTTAVWVCVIGNFFSMLYPYTADQTMVQRYLSTADIKDARRAVWTNAWMTIPVSLIFFGLGTGLWAFFKHRPELLDPNLKNDAILPLFFMVQFPAGLKGVIIAGIFAAAMSSLDSSINSLASVLVSDYYQRFKKNATEVDCLRVARVVTVMLGCFGTGAALYLAGKETSSLFNDYLQLLGLAGGALAGTVALGMFTKRANGFGALTGALASSLLVTAVWQLTSVHFFLYGAIGFVASFVLGYGFSLAGSFLFQFDPKPVAVAVAEAE